MKIRYHNTLDDFVAFNEHHYAHSAATRRSDVPGRIALVVTCAVVFMVLGWVLAVLWVVFVGLYVLLYSIWQRRSHRNLVRRLYNEGFNKGSLGEHELEMTEAGLVDRTKYGEATVLWPAIERVVSTPSHTFIYTGALMAHVDPRDAVTEGNYEMFVEAVSRRVEQEQAAAEPVEP